MIPTHRLPYLVAVAAMLLCARPTQADTNGGSGGPQDDPPIVVDANWFASEAAPPAFYWGSGANAPNLEGPFTFNAGTQVRLDVTDDFDKGDRFQVFDFGASLGLTTLVPTLSGGEVGPQAAFSDPTYSHGSFFLPAGAHSITLNTVVNPHGQGRGYLRVLTAVPEPTSILLLLAGLMLTNFSGRRRDRRNG